MALFGRRANQQSSIADVPPELQPYYRQETAGARARRVALTFIPIIIAILLIGGAIWGLIWVNHHKPAPHPSSNGQVAQNNQPQPSGNSSQGSQSSNSNSGSSSSQNGGASQAQITGSSPPTSTSGNPSTQNATKNTIPNTGPDASVVALSVLTTVGGTTAYHARQVRRVRRDS